jgi:hypothetical protein
MLRDALLFCFISLLGFFFFSVGGFFCCHTSMWQEGHPYMFGSSFITIDFEGWPCPVLLQFILSVKVPADPRKWRISESALVELNIVWD